MRLRIKSFNILGLHWKILFLKVGEGGFMKNQYIGSNCLKRRVLGQFPDLRGRWVGKKDGGWYPNAQYVGSTFILGQHAGCICAETFYEQSFFFFWLTSRNSFTNKYDGKQENVKSFSCARADRFDEEKEEEMDKKDNKLDQNREKLRYYGNIVQEWKTQMGFRRWWK